MADPDLELLATPYIDNFKNLMSVLNQLRAKYDGAQKAGLGEWWKTISDLLSNLNDFAEKQFNFFYYGFKGGDKEKGIPWLHLETAKDTDTIPYPLENVLGTIVAQISIDLTSIQLAAEQRILANQENDPFKLDAANDRALDALKGNYMPGEVLPSDMKVLPYLTDSVRVRVMPYSNVALIGVPYMWSTNYFISSSVLFHEVGHYRFWYPFHATKAQVELLGRRWDEKDFLLNARELYYPFSSLPAKPNWSEEVFADVYSVCKGGMLPIVSAMNLALEHSPKTFSNFDLDNPHPTPLIRPLLMLKAFAAMVRPLTLHGTPIWGNDQGLVEEVEKDTFQLFNYWKRLLEKRQTLRVWRAPDQTNDDSQALLCEFVDPNVGSEVAKITDWNSTFLNRNLAAERLVEDALMALSNIFGPQDAPRNNSLGEAKTPKEIIENFASSVKAQIPSSGADSKNTAEIKPNPSAATKNVWQDWVDGKRYFDYPLPEEMWAGDFDKVMDPRTRPSNTWLPLFGAGGWTTEGPCAHPPL